MDYEDPACAYCPPNVRACRAGDSEKRGPGFCPIKVDPETITHARGRDSSTGTGAVTAGARCDCLTR